MTIFHSIILGLLQGLTELFPVSSLGHSVLIPHILGWNLNESDNSFVIFLVATHLATALVLVGFYFKDWVSIVKGIFRSLSKGKIEAGDHYAKMGWLLVVATIPAGLLGLIFEKKLTNIFSNPVPVSIFLILNGLVLLVIEKTKKPHTGKISNLSFVQSIKIGLAQCLALLPGFSRTGSSLGGSLMQGLDHGEAAHFSFLLATPIILAASLLKIPQLFKSHIPGEFTVVLVGFVSAAIAAYLSVKFLSKYFKTKTLKPFGWYCVIAGILALIMFL